MGHLHLIIPITCLKLSGKPTQLMPEIFINLQARFLAS